MVTPQNQAKKLADALGLPTDLYLKREDLHPYGSHKGRSIPVMIEKYIQDGWQQFCISSSGNAALAAAMYIRNHNKEKKSPLSLKIFIGIRIPKEKLEPLKMLSLEDSRIIIEQAETPKRAAFQLDKEGTYKNLRQSTDDTALTGYGTLADELAQIENLSAVFVPTSSGTTAQGLFDAFKKHKINPQIHIVQTPKCHPFIDSDVAGASLATAIVDTVGYRKNAIQRMLDQSKGAGWIVKDDEIVNAQKLTRAEEGFEISSNSALSIAGLQLAIKSGRQFIGSIVCLITGR